MNMNRLVNMALRHVLGKLARKVDQGSPKQSGQVTKNIRQAQQSMKLVRRMTRL